MNYPLQQAKLELQVFAKTKNNIGQSVFRSAFFNTREHVLGKKASMTMGFEECVQYCVQHVREYVDPTFEPQFASLPSP